MLAALALLGLSAAAPRMDPDPWPRPPTSATEVRREIAAGLERSDRSVVTRGVITLARMGAALSPETQARLLPLLDPSAQPTDWRSSSYPLPQRLAGLFTYNAAPRNSDETVFATVPSEHRLIEGIAWDGANRRLFTGSVIDRRVIVRDGEAWRTVPMSAPIGGVFGMAVDSPRRLLWFASAAFEPISGPEPAFSGLVAIDLDRLAEARRVAIPGARLGDVALASDGTLYASDGRSGAIYRCRPGCTEAELMIPPGLLRSPQGMAVWPGDRILYVADYERGLYRIDLASLRIRQVVAREPLMLDGIDGMMLFHGSLVAIQNGTRPRRIVRIDLEPGGRIVRQVKLVERNPIEWGEPTLGVIADDMLLYVADGQWERYGAGGTLTDGGSPRPTAIRRTDNLWDIILTQDTRQGPPSALAPAPAGS